jgi:hypothetical protein
MLLSICGQQRGANGSVCCQILCYLNLVQGKNCQLVESRGSTVPESVGKLHTVIVTKNRDLGKQELQRDSQKETIHILVSQRCEQIGIRGQPSVREPLARLSSTPSY